MSDIFNWNFVDQFMLYQVVCFWCGKDFVLICESCLLLLLSEIMVVKQMLVGEFEVGYFDVIGNYNDFLYINDYKGCFILRLLFEVLVQKKNVWL